MAKIHDDLREVMGLLGKATPGPWAHTKRNDPEAPASIASGMDSGMAYAVAMCPRFRGDDWHKDADAIVSAVTFLRQHGPALLARQEGEDDSARLDYIERTFSGMTNRERYLPVQMIWGKGANGRTLREACDKYMAAEAARSGGGG